MAHRQAATYGSFHKYFKVISLTKLLQLARAPANYTLVLLAAKISFNADKASCDITFIFTLQHSGITSNNISPIADFLATWDATPVEPSPSKSPLNHRFSQRLLGSAHILPSADPQTPTRRKSCNGNKQN